MRGKTHAGSNPVPSSMEKVISVHQGNSAWVTSLEEVDCLSNTVVSWAITSDTLELWHGESRVCGLPMNFDLAM